MKMCRIRKYSCIFVITFGAYVFGITLGSSDLLCTSYSSEALVFPMCNNKTLNTTVKFVENGPTAIYFNSYYSHIGTSSDCSCDVMMDPSPYNISVNYRRSSIRGCALISFYTMPNHSSECRTQEVRLNKTLPFVLFSTRSSSITEYACFGMEIEDLYLANRKILVTCKPSNNDDPIENEETVVSIYSRLTARKLKENSSDSAMIFTFQTVISSTEDTSSIFAESYATTNEVTNTSNDFTPFNNTNKMLQNNSKAYTKQIILVASCGVIIYSLSLQRLLGF